jgi:hypothetical protein
VGLTLPSELTEPLGWIGLTWPEADEELLFEAGQQWISYGEQLTQVAQSADAAAGTVWQSGQGEAVDAFQAWWTNPDGPRTRLAEDAAAAVLIGSALLVFAAITLALKIAFIVQLILLAIEVAQAIATAFVTFGATTAEVPGFIAATRLIYRKLIQQVIEHITTVIKDILLKAKNLLKKTESRLGRRTATDAAHHTPGIPGPMTVKRFEGKPMLEHYRYETDPTHLANPFRRNPPPNNEVLRLTQEQREAYRVGRIRRQGCIAQRIRRLGPRHRRRRVGPLGEWGQSDIRDGRTWEPLRLQVPGRGSVPSLDVVRGQPVAAAGELSVVNGRIDHVTSASGHY